MGTRWSVGLQIHGDGMRVYSRMDWIISTPWIRIWKSTQSIHHWHSQTLRLSDLTLRTTRSGEFLGLVFGVECPRESYINLRLDMLGVAQLKSGTSSSSRRGRLWCTDTIAAGLQAITRFVHCQPGLRISGSWIMQKNLHALRYGMRAHWRAEKMKEHWYNLVQASVSRAKHSRNKRFAEDISQWSRSSMFIPTIFRDWLESGNQGLQRQHTGLHFWRGSLCRWVALQSTPPKTLGTRTWTTATVVKQIFDTMWHNHIDVLHVDINADVHMHSISGGIQYWAYCMQTLRTDIASFVLAV